MCSVKFTVIVAAVLLAGLFPGLGAPENSTNTTAREWGETIGGFQMASSVDESNGLIHCWVRNNGTHEVVFMATQIGHWGSADLEIQEGTNWVGLLWSQSWSLIDLSWASVITNRLQPRQIITNATGMSYAHKIGRLGVDLPMPVSHGTIQINGGSFESPKPGDTFTLELMAFDWPAHVLQPRLLKARVCQKVSTPVTGARPYVLQSRIFTLDSSVIKSLIDREHRDKKP
jgi:hypothetical protein